MVKNVIVFCLFKRCKVLKKSTIGIIALRAAQKEAISLLKVILDKEEALLRAEESNKTKQSQMLEEREETVKKKTFGGRFFGVLGVLILTSFSPLGNYMDLAVIKCGQHPKAF